MIMNIRCLRAYLPLKGACGGGTVSTGLQLAPASRDVRANALLPGPEVQVKITPADMEPSGWRTGKTIPCGDQA